MNWILSLLQFIDDYTGFFTPVVSLASALVIIIQIRSTITLNRKNLTFEKIKELEELLYGEGPLREIIKKIGLLEGKKPVGYNKAYKIFKENKYLLYQLLNYFESLSLAVIEKNIDEDILFQIYGKRLQRAYIKLHPFIDLIVRETEPTDSLYEPYQHFDELFEKVNQYLGGKKGLWKRLRLRLKR